MFLWTILIWVRWRWVKLCEHQHLRKRITDRKKCAIEYETKSFHEISFTIGNNRCGRDFFSLVPSYGVKRKKMMNLLRRKDTVDHLWELLCLPMFSDPENYQLLEVNVLYRPKGKFMIQLGNWLWGSLTVEEFPCLQNRNKDNLK